MQKKSSNNSRKLTKREEEIHRLKEDLLKQRQQLLSEAESAINVMPGNGTFPDMGDQASAEVERSFMLRLRSREQKLLQKIDAALEKIEEGAFGICESCGTEIEIKRLEARPVTTMCIDCKTAEEEKERLSEQ